MQFAQTTEVIPGVDGRRIAHIQCYNCKKHGHYSDQCPDPPDSVVGDQHHINAFELAMEDYCPEATEEEEEVTTVTGEAEAPSPEEEGADLDEEGAEDEGDAVCNVQEEWGVNSSDDDD